MSVQVFSCPLKLLCCALIFTHSQKVSVFFHFCPIKFTFYASKFPVGRSSSTRVQSTFFLFFLFVCLSYFLSVQVFSYQFKFTYYLLKFFHYSCSFTFLLIWMNMGGGPIYFFNSPRIICVKSIEISRYNYD